MIRKIIKWFATILALIVIIPVIIITIVGEGFGDRPYAELNDGRPIIFAHRGLTNYFAENSLEGFTHCKKRGFKAVEIDIRHTKDNRLMVFHDKNCYELLGIDTAINDINADFLQGKHLIYRDSVTKNTVMSLDQFLLRFKDSFIIYLDIKDNTKTVADSLLPYFKKYDIYNNVLVANIIFASYLKFNDRNILTVLEGIDTDREWYYHIIPKRFKPDFYSSFIFKVDEKHFQFFRENGILDKKILYGVNKDNLLDVYKLGAQHILLDYNSTLGTIEEIENKLLENKLN